MGSCFSMLRPYSTPATEEESTSLLFPGPDVTVESFNIQVGNSIDAQTVRIPRCVLEICPVLKDNIKPGCKIINADPAVFELFIEHLYHHSTLGLTTFSAPGHLEELTHGEDPLLDFSKGWHTADMLQLPELQNIILKIYSGYYIAFLADPVSPNAIQRLRPEPFTYLRETLGRDTNAEKFLIDFYAGLLKTHKHVRKRQFRLLPIDISRAIQQRWHELHGRRDSAQPTTIKTQDRIASHDPCFYINESSTPNHSALQVQYLCETAGPGFGFNPPLRASNCGRGPYFQAKLDGLLNRRVYRDMRSHSVNSAGFVGAVSMGDESGSPRPRFDRPFVRARSYRKRVVGVFDSEVPGEADEEVESAVAHDGGREVGILR